MWFQGQSGGGGDSEELQRRLAESEAEAKKAQQEMDRLLQVVKVSQDEVTGKEKLIKELQEYVYYHIPFVAETFFIHGLSVLLYAVQYMC